MIECGFTEREIMEDFTGDTIRQYAEYRHQQALVAESRARQEKNRRQARGFAGR